MNNKAACPSSPYSWASRPVSTLRAGASPSDTDGDGGEEDEEAIAAAAAAEKEAKAIEEGAAAAKAMMDATAEFRAKQVGCILEGLRL